MGLRGSLSGEIVLFPLEDLRILFVGGFEGERLGMSLRDVTLGSLFCTQVVLTVRDARVSLGSDTRLILTEGMQDRAIIETTFCTLSFSPLR